MRRSSQLPSKLQVKALNYKGAATEKRFWWVRGNVRKRHGSAIFHACIESSPVDGFSLKCAHGMTSSLLSHRHYGDKQFLSYFVAFVQSACFPIKTEVTIVGTVMQL